ncbi:MAG TPA: TMEM175 family protein [Gemmatimonadales bacterium]|nr:TMEM175 family protein [Gemmatimonadales bacterium]
MDEQEARPPHPRYRTGRLEAFSDGVFAIAITLLVLEIGVPAGSGGHLLGALGDQWPSYLAYLVSFSTIGAVWFAHTVITEYLDHADPVLLRLNLLLLLVVSFLPFPTKLLAEYVQEAAPERIAATVYGINLLLALVMVSVTWRYAVRERLVSPNLADEDVKTLTKRLTPTLGFYVLMILVGLFLPIAAVLGYLALALFILVPFSTIRRRPSGG